MPRTLLAARIARWLGVSLFSAALAVGACADDGIGDPCKMTRDCQMGLVCDPVDQLCKRKVDLLPDDAGLPLDASARDTARDVAGLDVAADVALDVATPDATPPDVAAPPPGTDGGSPDTAVDAASDAAADAL